MINFLPTFLLMIISSALVIINIICSLTLISITGLIKFILPFAPVQRPMRQLADSLLNLWACINTCMISLINKVEWDIKITGDLNKSSWYLLISNHHSWTDIVILFSVFSNKIPLPKFFVKQEIIYIPFVGTACWALDMPFMKRYSKQLLAKKPHLKGKDMESTRKACSKAKLAPTTIVNFAEGSRFTEHKKQQTKSPYQYLLPPKSGGIALSLASMGSTFNKILDVTIIYPDNPDSPFKDLLQGKLKRIVIRVETIEITTELQGDYENDATFKHNFQQWVTSLWQRKDQQIATYNQQK
ncbi:acyltransferase [Moritella sp. F3]|uniref:acyltransferase n=1 Tax=Moritella sp. F3 TaxID=2718882 RepID=UPI0018E1945D|nr:acyltransferase [Moritella sp. F3]GIC78401.1 acyltransferase [Moritella sp. F1]GIC83901.1 acyltransferase [Moritella sp. F3]